MFKYQNLFLIFAVSSALGSQFASADIFFSKGAPHIKLTENAGYAGILRFSRDGRPYAAFEGIQYAFIPERFAASELVTRLDWEGFKNATEAGVMCPQPGFFGIGDPNKIIGEENCLFMNVYVPMMNSKVKEGLPVMLSIHSGGFGVGTADLGPKFLMDEGVIHVNLNYRVGVLGFLSTGDQVIPGNNGLKDQVVALKWVQKNIRKFGGNPDLVTIFGVSAGGASTSYLMLSPSTKGLIHRVISQAGSALGPWAYEPKPKKMAQELASFLECSGSEKSEDIVSCLRQAPLDKLVKASADFKDCFPPGMCIMNFVPVAEPEGTPNAFMTESPWSALENGRLPQALPWMVGMAREEGYGFFGGMVAPVPELVSMLDTKWDELAAKTFYLYKHLPEEKHQSLAKKLREFYFPDGKPVSFENRKGLYDAYSDSLGIFGIKKAAMHAALKGKAPIYAFQFSYYGQKDWIEFMTMSPNPDKYVSHGAEFLYLTSTEDFPIPGMSDFVLNEKDEQFSRDLVKLWVSFAKYGEPKHNWGSSPERKWTPMSKEEAEGKKTMKWYNIDANPGMIDEPFKARMEFWEELWKSHFAPGKLEKTEL